MRGIKTSTAALALILLGSVAHAQNIGVNINGQPVRFAGVGPQQVSGRVMVPVRGIFEALGAYVGYDPVARKVNAQRGNIDLSLGIGQRLATVNGRDVTLDVPAQIIRGSTMVPLRFIGETLGADVTWNAAAQVVNISTTDASNSNTDTRGNVIDNGSEVDIRSFSSSNSGIVRGGSNLEFVLEGTPGGQATLQIPGIAGEIPMREVSRGRYTATLKPPVDTPISVQGANAIARLRVNGRERLIQSSNTISIDTQAPTITEFTPETGARFGRSRPNITATFSDSGTGVDPNSVKLTLDGRDVTRDASVTKGFVAYRPAQNLTAGKHRVVVSGRDLAGNPLSKEWTFDVIGDSEIIKSFAFSGTQDPQPGDVIRVTMTAEPGGAAWFSVGKKLKNIRMTETSPGKYEGEYTVKRNEIFRNENVVGRFRTKAGEVFNTDATQKLGVRVGPPPAPRITSPSTDETVANSLVVKGKTDPKARVRIKVDYKASGLLALLGVGGSLGEQIVEADENGNFRSDAFNMSSLANGKDMTYTVTAVALGTNDEESDATTLTFKRG